jgi:hypothetical protein
VLVLCGCSRKSLHPDNLPKLIPRKIIIAQEQTPLAETNVSLHSVTVGTSQWVSGGQTDANGVAEIRTNDWYGGVPAGKFVKKNIVRFKLKFKRCELILLQLILFLLFQKSFFKFIKPC